MHTRLPRLRQPRVSATPILVAIAFSWIVAAMFAVLIVASSAIGVYEAVLLAEVTALVIVALTLLALRLRPAETDAERRIQRRHRERRGF